MTDNGPSDAGPGFPATLDETTSERLLSISPVVVRRRVHWGECDPAQVVYTPRFGDYVVAAYGWFARAVLGDSLVIDSRTRLATPIKAMTLEFHRVLVPGEIFDMTVSIVAVRNRTFDLLVQATSPAGEARFTGWITPIVVNAASFTSEALPANAREALANYQKQNGAAHEPRAPRSV